MAAAVCLTVLCIAITPTISGASSVRAKAGSDPLPKTGAPAVGTSADTSAAGGGDHRHQPYYLSLGDSYSVGLQPGIGPTVGYTGFVSWKDKLQLENFGCSGATTTSLLNSIGCGQGAAYDPVAYPTETQEQAVLDFISAHPAKVSLITVSIGGNDIDNCSGSLPTNQLIACLEADMTTIGSNVSSLVSALTQALNANGDSGAHIVGLTYPDVDLGDWVWPPSSPNQALATFSVAGFDDLLNPTLQKAYTSVPDGSFVNVTQAPYKKATAGDDTPLTTIQDKKPYGKIPAAVAEICELTYYCSQGNIHANNRGYTFIGKLITDSLGPSN